MFLYAYTKSAETQGQHKVNKMRRVRGQQKQSEYHLLNNK